MSQPKVGIHYSWTMSTDSWSETQTSILIDFEAKDIWRVRQCTIVWMTHWWKRFCVGRILILSINCSMQWKYRFIHKQIKRDRERERQTYIAAYVMHVKVSSSMHIKVSQKNHEITKKKSNYTLILRYRLKKCTLEISEIIMVMHKWGKRAER